MGNSCAGPTLGKNGLIQSVTAAVWRTRPSQDRLTPGTHGEKSKAGPANNELKLSDREPPKPYVPIQEMAPQAVQINAPQNKNVEPEKPSKAEPAEETSKPPESGNQKKPTHMKRLSSAGLLVDSVLGRKTANLKELYTLGRKLGQGQFGTTFLCLEKATGKELACKSILKRKLTTEEDVEDVRREIRIMHHLAGHPHIINIVDAFEDAVAVHVVMELCSGGELFDRIIQRGHYSEKQAAELARVIVGVVEQCHCLGVMHRDLKPENFLFVNHEEESPLKTIDFGLSIFFKPGICLNISVFLILILLYLHDK